MQCPACQKDLSPLAVEGMTVQICKSGCEGVWLDHLQLKKLEDPNCKVGQAIIDAENRGPRAGVDASKRRKCPACGIVMMRHFFSVKREIEVDECAGCGGVWLDYGELDKIRHQYSSEFDRQKATEKAFADMFDSQLDAQRQKEAHSALHKFVAVERAVHNVFARPL